MLIATGLLWSAMRLKPGVSVAGQSATHAAPSAPHPAYNSNPPASGWHCPGTARSLSVTHRPKNDSRIAVVAWQRTLKMDAYDEQAIRAFIRSFRNRGPERLVN